MRRKHGVVQLDDVDAQLAQLLAVDPRISNVALAESIGVTDETVAARLRKLLDAGALAMTALIDWEAAGFAVHAFVRVSISHRSPAQALEPLASSGAAHTVAITTGSCDAVVGLLAPDLDTLREQLVASVRSLPSDRVTSMMIVTEACKLRLDATTLPLHGWSTDLLRHARVELDDLDLQLIDLLVSHGHESNRWLARRLSVADGTVRSRLRRLEDSGLLRIAAVSDTVTLDEVRSAAYAFVDVTGDDADVVATLLAHPNVGALDRCVGDFDLVVFAVAESESELHGFLTGELRDLEKVARVETASVVEALHHKANLVRLL